MEKVVQQVMLNWTIRRVIGLLIGLFVAIQALVYQDPLLGVLSAFFLFQVLLNTGCFGASACSIDFPTQLNDKTK